MSILVGEDTRLAVSGLTGREGSYHALNNRRYGTNVVAGITPGKGGQDVEGVPVFNTFREAVEATGANTAMIFVPPRFAADSILEAEDAGIATIIAITEGIPAHDELMVFNVLKRNPDVRFVGPNCPGVLSPGKANVGIIPAAFFKPGNVGVVSRSGTLTYQIGNELAQSGFGNSTIVGIGGDPVPGSSFVDIIALFEADPDTELIVMSGEIGGSAEEEAATYIAEHVSKPVVGYVAGLTAPPGKTMGHAGAIVSGSSGGGQAKIDALESVGVRVGRTPTQVAAIAVEILGGYGGFAGRASAVRSDLAGWRRVAQLAGWGWCGALANSIDEGVGARASWRSAPAFCHGRCAGAVSNNRRHATQIRHTPTAAPLMAFCARHTQQIRHDRRPQRPAVRATSARATYSFIDAVRKRRRHHKPQRPPHQHEGGESDRPAT